MSAYDHKLQDEAGRVAALHRYDVLDTVAEAQFDLITAMVKDLLNVPICAVSLVDTDRQWFKSQQGLDVGQTPRSISFCDRTIRTRQFLIVEDAEADPRFMNNPLVTGGPNIRSYVGAPLTTPDGYNIGALCAIDRKPRTFSEADLALLERFSSLVVEQLELRTLAMIDPLTGALSRRAFVEAARQALVRQRAGEEAAAIVAFDLDHFKPINDRFGHLAGNEVLQEVGNLCLRLLRPRDRLGRLGGEEFAALLTGCNVREALGCAERIRKSLAATPMPAAGPVTASFGVAMLDRWVELGEWFSHADKALQVAKSAGRNRCEVYEREAHGPAPCRRRRDLTGVMESSARWRSE